MTSINISTLLTKIGKNLHTIRNSRKETLQSVAASIGITHPILSKVENGRYKTLQLGLLIKLCSYYEVSLQQIMELDMATIFQISNYGEGSQKLIGQELAAGYELYIKQLQQEILYLKEQNIKLIDVIGKS
ncbi:MAG: helix-turn-helix domain-containing protein [Flavobacteriaceae bacterium]|jgi:transcriptional regulator with XRE-family HTH domain|nr:helix-turn-helix domain-containing protein [Flavobacteriaceae bacterium]